MMMVFAGNNVRYSNQFSQHYNGTTLKTQNIIFDRLCGDETKSLHSNGTDDRDCHHWNPVCGRHDFTNHRRTTDEPQIKDNKFSFC